MKKFLLALLSAVMLTVPATAWNPVLTQFDFRAFDVKLDTDSSLITKSSQLYPYANTIYLEVRSKQTTWAQVFSRDRKGVLALDLIPYGVDGEAIRKGVYYRVYSGMDMVDFDEAMKTGAYLLKIDVEGYNPQLITCNVMQYSDKFTWNPEEDPSLHTLVIYIPANTVPGTKLVVTSLDGNTVIESRELSETDILRSMMAVDLGSYKTSEVMHKFIPKTEVPRDMN